ncbi:phage late control D protein [Roseibium sp. TrichSKD4]|uniref:phage late control D family protein n=1 Tax=Roseibium sp. TrichSKD4 TaxID=744980 RepID=UPI0001E569C7|nr:contractile injection system protein, VgrG/Pvc8 family [Roseibium sp. TrichSKD4]EFO32506.1 phage late control D protein [Roseibium sp. TrichSKD4]
MTGLPKPFVSLLVNGVDVGSALAPFLLDFTWTDNLHGKADEVCGRMRDDLGLWRGAWRPEQGDIIEVPALGYEGGLFVPVGSFQVDIPKASGSRAKEIIEFKATSAFPEKDQRTQKSKSYQETDLKKIINEVAGRLGYSVSGEIEPVSFKVKKQRRERDLAFIKRLAEDYGYFVSVKDREIVFYKREDLEAQGPVRTIDIVDGSTLISWSAEENNKQVYSKAKVSYLDPDKKALIEGEVQDLGAKSGDTLKIDERVEDEGQAKKLAKCRLAKANENRATAKLTLVGDPLLMAGQVIQLGLTFGKYAGKYLVHVATHKIARASYTTSLELKRVE